MDPVTGKAASKLTPEVRSRCDRHGVTLIQNSDPEYPARLHHLHDPPPVLFYRGELDVLHAPCVAVVGSRQATAYGRRAAEEISRAAVRAGWTVVSGMALGIDGAAHGGALAGKGATAAVLGSGPDRAYPRAHQRLMERILERGLVLSEHPPEVTPRAYHFPRRNRLLAALAERVVVVEAARRSGALITASLATEMGREVWAVPGSIFSPGSLGTHALLVDGAVPVASLDGWAESLVGDLFGPGRYGSMAGRPEASPPGGGLPTRIWRLLGAEPRSVEELAASLHLPPASLLPALTALELDGWVDRTPGPGFLRKVA